MYFYYLKAVKNYKEIFQFIRATEMERFNGRLYFYCVNNGINPSAVPVDLSKVPFIITEGQSHTKLPKKLWDRTEQMEGYERAMLSKGR